MVMDLRKEDGDGGSGIRRRIEEIRERIAASARRSGRSLEDVLLVGVSKFQRVDSMYAAMDCGVAIFGENRVQERERKALLWNRGQPVWHMIGHLQRNKARKAIELFDCVESVDSLELAETMDRILREKADASECRKEPYPVFVEVNTSGESSKEGVSPDGLYRLVESIVTGCPRIRVEGLMTIGPLSDDEKKVRAAFSMLREFGDGLRRRFGIEKGHLSMGMTGDFEAAIEEGSTLVRIGTGIFGVRSAI